MTKARGNFRRDHHAAYLIWRQRMRYAQAEIREVPDETYIAQVAAGKWCDEETGAWRDPVLFDFRGINSVESAVAHLEQTHPGGSDAVGEIAARSLFEVERFEFRWDVDGVRDPADAYISALDHRTQKFTLVLDALLIVRVRKRYRCLDLVLDMCSIDGDPGFAAGLVDLVRTLNPGYGLHCWQKRERLSHRGRGQRGRLIPAAHIGIGE